MSSADPGAVHHGGRYAIHDRIAAGGMASVHFGLLRGPSGFRRVVAIKRLHAQLAHDPELVAMFLDEARMASRVRHPNVVPMLDVVHEGGEVVIVMEYVAGEALSRLLAAAAERGAPPPPAVAVAVAAGVLHGLHAAHEARDDRGEPLDLVHRDVSPQNVLVGADGVARVVDFGIAKATGRSHTTRDGKLKGKMPYMAPEQLRAGTASRQSDIWAASVVLWEMLTGKRLFDGDSEGHIYSRILHERAPPPSTAAPSIPPELDAIVGRGLQRAPERRFATARDMALALEQCVAPSTAAQVGAWVESLASGALAERAARLLDVERRAAAQVPGPAAAAVDAALATPASAGAAPSSAPLAADAAPSSATPAALTRRHAVVARQRSFALAMGVGLALAAGVAALLALRAPAALAPAGAPAPAAASGGELPALAPPARLDVAMSASAAARAAAASAAHDAGAPPGTPGAPATSASPKGAPSAGASPRRLPPAGAPESAGRRRPPRAPARPDTCRTLDDAGIWHVRPECL
ncbi:serine/threonine-protein kinase [Sorangium sp. So ce1036]|uniref:serine/threonine-protein kinase n=1 Tax=Sorangium sp. So ce1036 TaxID=3133328 RepID=UPI003F07F0CE